MDKSIYLALSSLRARRRVHRYPAGPGSGTTPAPQPAGCFTAASGASRPPADLAELARLQSTADHLLRTAVTGEAADAGAIDHLNACSAAAAVAPQLNWPVNGRPRMWLSTSGDSGAHVLGVIARSVIELLAGERARLRVCEAHGCRRVYLSASARRRWCSDACGNRVRVARHAARRQLTG